MAKLILNKGRDSSLRRHHPWIFSGGVKRVEGKPALGDTLDVISHEGEWLARAAYSPNSQIRARVWSFDSSLAINADFFHGLINSAVQKRAHLLTDERNCFRLIHGESDYLPGLVVDRYDDYLVCQFLFAGVEVHKRIIADALAAIVPCKGIFERSDTNARGKEGLEPSVGVLWGEAPPEKIAIKEAAGKFWVDARQGHKTGFYLDQAENRAVIRDLAQGKKVLNCFSYTGGFAVAALNGGAAKVTNVDSSGDASAMAAENFALNGFANESFENRVGNAFEVLRELQNSGEIFDLIILDPPKFAENKSQVNKAARAYKDIALQGAKLLKPGGLLVNFSCSGAIDLPLFQKITADAVLDAGRRGQIVRYMEQGEDHPIALPFPESLYLKGLVCRLD